MKKVILFGLLSLIYLTACSTSSVETDQTKTPEKLIANTEQLYVGFAIDTLREERWYRDKSVFEEKVQELGGRVKTLAANGDQNVQIEQAKLLIKEGVDVLVVVPTHASGASEIVELAHEADVKVISYDRLILNANVDYYLSFDNVKVGELQATEILKHVDQGRFAYVGGSETDNNAILFRQGAMNILKPLIDNGDITLVYDQYTPEWSPETARDNFSDFLNSNNEVDAVIAANDGTAGGVIEALGNKAGDIPVSGQDAELAGVKRIVSGTQTMTVFKSINLIAEKAAEMAMQLASGKKIETDTTVNIENEEVPATLLTPISVTKENIEGTIIKENHLTSEEIYE